MPPFKNIVFFTMRHLVLLASLFLKAEQLADFYRLHQDKYLYPEDI